MADLLTRIRAHALANAIKFGGRANSNNVLPKIIGEFPDVKSKMKETREEIDSIVNEVNSMDKDSQHALLEQIAPEFLEKKEKVERLDNMRELDDVDLKKGVVMRFAPSPSGPMHIGHAITGGLTSLYVKRYGGKFILRIEDTNSDNIYTPAYEMLPEDAKWIFGNVNEVWIQSDRMQIYYSYVEKFLELNAVYICTCSQEEFKVHVENMQDCPCRNLGSSEHKSRWKKMFDKENGFKEGDCVVRFKADMSHPNPAMRDFPLVRINDSEHPRQSFKYRVWPLMNLCVTVDDIEAGMTHIIRAKEHMDNAKRQEMMYAVLGIKPPKAYFLGRYNFEGLEISCSKTRAKIDAGVFNGWDDIRVPFLCALKRRGYQSEVFLKYSGLTGISQVDKTVPGEEFFKTINSFNRDILEPISKRLFFVPDPVKIVVHGAENRTVEQDLHPSKQKGGRVTQVSDTYYVSAVDIDLIKGKRTRLMGNLTMQEDGGKYSLLRYESIKDGHDLAIQWVADNEYVACEVMMPDATIAKGFAEKNISNLKVDDIIQFERFGFCRLDAIDDGVYKFWYTHK